MASITTEANGCKRIRWVHDDKSPGSLRLGKVEDADAEYVKLKIEELLRCRDAGRDVVLGAELRGWLDRLSDRLYERLVRARLVPPRCRMAKITLGELVKRVEDAATVKQTTKLARRQATDSLLSHFGEKRPAATITPEEAAQWHRSLIDSKLARATISKRVKNARMVFARGVQWKLLTEDPLRGIKRGSEVNADRLKYIPRETIRKVLDECPDDHWRGIVALSRFAGLRCPSEVALLRVGDVNIATQRLSVRSPKTEGHAGRGIRIVPIDRELLPILERLVDAAQVGEELLLPRLRDARKNLRTHFERIIARAGVAPWDRLFQNLRASCEMDWAELVPVHAAAAALGHSERVSVAHYLKPLDHHFDKLAEMAGTERGPKSGHRDSDSTPRDHPRQVATPSRRIEAKPRVSQAGFGVSRRGLSRSGERRIFRQVTPAGLEPATKGL